MIRTPYISNSLSYAHLLKRRVLSWCSYITMLAFMVNTMGPLPLAQAQEFSLPAPGQMVALSPALNPAVLKGIKLDARDPFKFHFFVDKGDSGLSVETPLMASLLQKESEKLIKYFLASLTIPENDLWVNLSPYEKDRIVPEEFGQTQMGRDLLAEDYILKQITASLIYPESKLGKEFWQKVYAQAQDKYGTTNIPINTFNKVWILPDKAVVYENGGTAFILENHLKVMLEQDYLALSKNTVVLSAAKDLKMPLDSSSTSQNDVNALGSKIVREIVIPALTKEVNEGKNFSQLRQVFYSLILATWYKQKIKDSILNKIYSDRKKTQGLVIPAKAGIQVKAIYDQYLKAFKKGVYNYIKEEPDPLTNQTIPRKYFSGGVLCKPKIIPEGPGEVSPAQISDLDLAEKRVFDEEIDFAMTKQPIITEAEGTLSTDNIDGIRLEAGSVDGAMFILNPMNWDVVHRLYLRIRLRFIFNSMQKSHSLFRDSRFKSDPQYKQFFASADIVSDGSFSIFKFIEILKRPAGDVDLKEWKRLRDSMAEFKRDIDSVFIDPKDFDRWVPRVLVDGDRTKRVEWALAKYIRDYPSEKYKDEDFSAVWNAQRHGFNDNWVRLVKVFNSSKPKKGIDPLEVRDLSDLGLSHKDMKRYSGTEKGVDTVFSEKSLLLGGSLIRTIEDHHRTLYPEGQRLTFYGQGNWDEVQTALAKRMVAADVKDSDLADIYVDVRDPDPNDPYKDKVIHLAVVISVKQLKEKNGLKGVYDNKNWKDNGAYFYLELLSLPKLKVVHFSLILLSVKRPQFTNDMRRVFAAYAGILRGRFPGYLLTGAIMNPACKTFMTGFAPVPRPEKDEVTLMKVLNEYEREALQSGTVIRSDLVTKVSNGGDIFDFLMKSGYFIEKNGIVGHPKILTEDRKGLLNKFLLQRGNLPRDSKVILSVIQKAQNEMIPMVQLITSKKAHRADLAMNWRPNPNQEAAPDVLEPLYTRQGDASLVDLTELPVGAVVRFHQGSKDWPNNMLLRVEPPNGPVPEVRLWYMNASFIGPRVNLSQRYLQTGVAYHFLDFNNRNGAIEVDRMHPFSESFGFFEVFTPKQGVVEQKIEKKNEAELKWSEEQPFVLVKVQGKWFKIGHHPQNGDFWVQLDNEGKEILPSKAYLNAKHAELKPYLRIEIEEGSLTLRNLGEQEISYVQAKNLPEEVSRDFDMAQPADRGMGTVEQQWLALIDQNFLGIKFIQNYFHVRKLVNPDGKPMKVLYAGSGPDAIAPIVAVGGSDIVMVTRDEKEFSAGNFKKFIDTYWTNGWKKSETISLKEGMKRLGWFMTNGINRDENQFYNALMISLKSMGVTRSEVEIGKDDKSIKINKQWPGQENKTTSLTFVSGDLSDPSRQSPQFDDLRGQEYDVVLEKAGAGLNLFSNWLPKVNGRCYVLDRSNVYNTSIHEDDPIPVLKSRFEVNTLWKVENKEQTDYGFFDIVIQIIGSKSPAQLANPPVDKAMKMQGYDLIADASRSPASYQFAERIRQSLSGRIIPDDEGNRYKIEARVLNSQIGDEKVPQVYVSLLQGSRGFNLMHFMVRGGSLDQMWIFPDQKIKGNGLVKRCLELISKVIPIGTILYGTALGNEKSLDYLREKYYVDDSGKVRKKEGQLLVVLGSAGDHEISLEDVMKETLIGNLFFKYLGFSINEVHYSKNDSAGQPQETSGVEVLKNYLQGTGGIRFNAVKVDKAQLANSSPDRAMKAPIELSASRRYVLLMALMLFMGLSNDVKAEEYLQTSIVNSLTNLPAAEQSRKMEWIKSPQVNQLEKRFAKVNHYWRSFFWIKKSPENKLYFDKKAGIYIGNLAKDDQSVHGNKFLETISNYMNFNMVRALAFDPEVRDELYNNRMNFELQKQGKVIQDKRPLALYIADTHDFDGAFMPLGEKQIAGKNGTIYSLIKAGYRVLYVEGVDIKKSVLEYTQFEDTSQDNILVLGAHGGPDALGNMSWLESDKKHQLMGKFRRVVLDSCSTGEGGDGMAVVATAMGDLFGAETFAPKNDIVLTTFDLDGSVKYFTSDGKHWSLVDPFVYKPKPAHSINQTMNSTQKGGIDLNPAQMSMQVKKEGQDFKFYFNGSEIDAAQVTGATFSIRSMTPVTNLLLALGLSVKHGLSV